MFAWSSLWIYVRNNKAQTVAYFKHMYCALTVMVSEILTEEIRADVQLKR